jgi:outer membrane protein OmpA-like peptidoglycan-associated protein
MKLVTILFLMFLSACSVQTVEMATAPTEQKFDLRDVEGDGVIGARDNCPDSYNGSQVDNLGCGSQGVEVVRRKLEVRFDANSYVVKPKYISEIKMLANVMTEHPTTKVTIEGHTSIRGKAKYNKILSQHRADAIKTILITHFTIAEDRINAIGYGFEQLLEEGDNEAVNARNRRIVAELSIDKKHINMKWHIYSVDNAIE